MEAKNEVSVQNIQVVNLEDISDLETIWAVSASPQEEWIRPKISTDAPWQ